MKILPNFKVETICSVLQQDFPELTIQEIKINDWGVDNLIAEVNDEIIFRFPRDEGVRFEEDMKVLEYLKDKIAMRIPEVKYIGTNYSYFGYDKIPGEHLTKEIYQALSEEEKERLAFDLANFLADIHRSISVEKAKELGISQNVLFWYLKNVKENRNYYAANKAILQFVDDNIERFEKILKENEELVCLHTDLHENNMAFDPNAKKLNGVYDFGDLSIGNLNFDFSSMTHFVNGDLTKRMMKQYESITGRKPDWEKASTYGNILSISDKIEYKKDPHGLKID